MPLPSLDHDNVSGPLPVDHDIGSLALGLYAFAYV